MKKICDLLLSKPLMLISWGYEFPILTETVFSFNVFTWSYNGRIAIQKEFNGYSLNLISRNKIYVCKDYKDIVDTLNVVLDS